MSKQVNTIDMTPTWVDILGIYVAVMERGNAEGRAIAKQEMRRMAEAADNWNASVKDAQRLRHELREAAAEYSRLWECLDEAGVSRAEAAGLGETL